MRGSKDLALGIDCLPYETSKRQHPKRAPSLLQALSVEEIGNTLNNPTAIKLHRDLYQLREHGAIENAVNEAQRKYKTYLHWLKTRALARWKGQ